MLDAPRISRRSPNRNVAALAARDVVRLAEALPATLEVNLFHRTEARVGRIVRLLERQGARAVLGLRPDARIPGIASKRALCHRDGIYRADVVLVPLEDGDRREALACMGKAVINVDLNLLSRTTLPRPFPSSTSSCERSGIRRGLRGSSGTFQGKPRGLPGPTGGREICARCTRSSNGGSRA